MQLKEKLENLKIDKGEFYTPDPTGLRTGNGVGPQLTETIEKVAQDAEMYIDKVGDDWPDRSRAMPASRLVTGVMSWPLGWVGMRQAQVSMKVALKRQIIQEKLDNMRGAVMMGESLPCA